MSCGMSMVKYTLFLFNLLCAICGILIITCGAMLMSNIHSFSDLTDAFAAQGLPVALIVLGSAVLIISFFGCCGAIRESSCMTMTYAAFLFVLLCCQVALVVYAFVSKEDFLLQMDKVVEIAWGKRDTTPAMMAGIETTYKCCGKSGPHDYNIQALSLPSSCCGLSQGNCNILNSYQSGCRTAINSFYKNNWDLVKYVGIGIAAIELIGLVFACCLANNVRNYRRRSAY